MLASAEERRENDALRERTSRLNAVILRINTSPDLDTIMNEIVESACALTGARDGAITTIDASGQPQDFVTSDLTTQERTQEREQLVAWFESGPLCQHFRDLPDAVRGRDLAGYIHSLGGHEFKGSTSFLVAPLRHCGVHVGTFFLGEKAGGREFTSEDQEVVVLFAAQAATAIANAVALRDERRARADLEALVDASPVGNLVLNAKTGRPLAVNREAKRILGDLCMDGPSNEQWAKQITCRFGDGRELTFDELACAETRDADEVVLSVPGGRSVAVLLNCTPIRSSHGGVESVVVTLQDLAPFVELERQRDQLLGLVSHELRAPLTSIKGSTTTVLNASRAIDPTEVRQFFRIIDQQADHMDGLIRDLLDAGRLDTGTLSISPEPTKVATLVDQARNTFLSGAGRHPLRIDLPRDLPWVMADRHRIVQVLNNLLSNAATNSPKPSPIVITAVGAESHVAISVSDRRGGVSDDQLPHLFRTPTPTARGLRGPGLGLAISRGLVEAHGGRIAAAGDEEGTGVRITFTIPIAPGVGTEPVAAPVRPAQSKHPSARVLVVDDDPQTLRHVREVLVDEGFSPLLSGDPSGLSELIRTERPQLVLLDLMLPGSDGIELMENVPELSDIPVIFLSGYGRDETIARSLEAGAADYIVKPFSPTELTARIRATLRLHAEPEQFVLGDIVIDYAQRQVTLGGRPVELTATEYDLLRVLSLSDGGVVTYGSLLRQVWRVRDDSDTARVRSVMVKLRRKLVDTTDHSPYIHNERGVGYRMLHQ